LEEKERRDKIYKTLKDKFKELKETSPVDYQKEMKKYLFGSEISLYKMRCDYLIPPQHYFQLYLKAARSEGQLDEFYNRQNIYFTEVIKRTKNQITLLEEILRHPKRSEKYEKLNFSRYYSKLNDDLLQLREEKTSEDITKEKEERKELLNRYGLMKALNFESEKSQHNFEKILFEKLQENGYDMSNLDMIDLVDAMKSLNIQQRIEIMQNDEKNSYSTKKGNLDLNATIPYETNFENYLTRSEKKYLNDDYLNNMNDENVQTIYQSFEQVKSKYNEDKIRNKKYFELLKKHNDRQVKKKDRADLSEIEKYGDVEKFRRL
jgi:hypothetical protein